MDAGRGRKDGATDALAEPLTEPDELGVQALSQRPK